VIRERIIFVSRGITVYEVAGYMYFTVFMWSTVILPAYEDGTDSVPKRRHIKFRRRGITQNKTYNIQQLFLSGFYEILKIQTDFGKMLKYQFQWKSFRWETSYSVRTDGRTKRYDKASTRSSQICERPPKKDAIKKCL